MEETLKETGAKRAEDAKKAVDSLVDDRLQESGQK